MDQEILAFVLKRIQKSSRIPAGADLATFDYRRSGHVDSIGIMKFVLDIEAEFGIEISETEMESASFCTVGGLVDIIHHHRLNAGTGEAG